MRIDLQGEADTIRREVPKRLVSDVVTALVSFSAPLASVALVECCLEDILVALAVLRPKPL